MGSRVVGMEGRRGGGERQAVEGGKKRRLHYKSLAVYYDLFHMKKYGYVCINKLKEK